MKLAAIEAASALCIVCAACILASRPHAFYRPGVTQFHYFWRSIWLAVRKPGHLGSAGASISGAATFTKSLNEISVWIDQTALSHAIQVTKWVVPLVQTIHILAIAVVASSVLMIDLRLIGVFWADRPMHEVSSRFLPLVWWPLLILLATGVIMIIGEPARSLKNPAFQLKMTLLVAALIVTGLFQLLQRRNPAFGDLRSGSRAAATTVAIVSMLLWSAIVFAGRWIAYYA